MKDKMQTCLLVLFMCGALAVVMFSPIMIVNYSLNRTDKYVQERIDEISKIEAEHRETVEEAISKGYKLSCYGEDLTGTNIDDLWNRFSFSVIDSEQVIILR